MLRWIEDYLARRAVMRTFGEYIAPEARDRILKGNLEFPEPERRDIEFVLVLLSTTTDEDMLQNYRSAIAIAQRHGYLIESLAGALLYLMNGILPFQEEKLVSPAELAEEIHREIGLGARLIYGTEAALVGSLGSKDYYTYTAMLSEFAELLNSLCDLPEGGCEEFGAD